MSFNVVDVKYAQTGASKTCNDMGMRDMQEKAFAHRDEQYMLLKAPPACGKSRALMFVALDKLINQNVEKVIVAVPERSIGASFSSTDLSTYGFFADWQVNDRYNLCTGGDDKGKVSAFKDFLASEEKVLVCTHATFRFAYEQTEVSDYDNCLVAIDEFHHVSANEDNKLGEVVRSLIANSTAHMMVMTGSYFRGDSTAILSPIDEAKFKSITYNYYDQLNGYEYLKSLGIGYHFYQGKYTEAIQDILDPSKKTIIHIPSVNSGESTKDKHSEVDTIIDHLGVIDHQDSKTGVIHVRRPNGEVLKVADLVWDQGKDRDRIMEFLRNVKSPEDVDIIIALGMAKEGFDWSFCEHALTVGYRGSLTEIIQIIGRCTRDSSNKNHAQFTNLIAQPDAAEEKVNSAVNNMLKAITCSLLMEQVLAPNFKFKRKKSEDEKPEGDNIFIRGLKEPSSERVKEITENDLNDLKALTLQDDQIVQAMCDEAIDPKVINDVLIPKVIQTKYPDLSEEEIEEVAEHLITDNFLKNAKFKDDEEGSGSDKRLIQMAGKFINIEDLHIDLIREINPFQKAYEMLSKSVTPSLLKQIRDTVATRRIRMTLDEAIALAPKIKAFKREQGRIPDLNAENMLEQRMAEAIIFIRNHRRQEGL